MQVMSIFFFQEEDEGILETLETYDYLHDEEKLRCINDAIYDLVVLREILKITMKDFKNDNNELN